MSGFAKIKRGCCFVRFQPCQDSESRGDRYEEKILADIIPFRRFGGTFINENIRPLLISALEYPLPLDILLP